MGKRRGGGERAMSSEVTAQVCRTPALRYVLLWGSFAAGIGYGYMRWGSIYNFRRNQREEEQQKWEEKVAALKAENAGLRQQLNPPPAKDGGNFFARFRKPKAE